VKKQKTEEAEAEGEDKQMEEQGEDEHEEYAWAKWKTSANCFSTKRNKHITIIPDPCLTRRTSADLDQIS